MGRKVRPDGKSPGPDGKAGGARTGFGKGMGRCLCQPPNTPTSPPSSPFYFCLPIPGTLSSDPPPHPPTPSLHFFLLLILLQTTVGPCAQRVLPAVSSVRLDLRKDFPGWGEGWRCRDPPIQLTGSDPVPHDGQEGVQVHSGLRALPIGVQVAGQCLEACVLGVLSCHSLQVGQYMGHSHNA